MALKVLIIEDSATSSKLVAKLVSQAKLEPVTALSLREAQHVFAETMPEEYLCAVVDYHLPDAPEGEAIDFAINAFLPTIVITGRMDADTRDTVLARDVVDYIPKENAQVYDYLSRLLARLEKNKHVGILVVDSDRSHRSQAVSQLRRHNFIIHQAASGREARDMLTENPHIKLVLVDACLSDIPSTRLISDWRKQYSKEDLAIIGFAEDEGGLYSARMLKSGANDFLRMPYCFEEFLCRITQNLEQLEHIETIRRAANSDYLTGLPNRRYFFHASAQFMRQGMQEYALALVDLDHFKRVNDKYGHDGGDAVLRCVAKRLAMDFRDKLVARFGGEEFCVFLPNTSAQEAAQLLEQFRRRVAEQVVEYNGQKLSISASIGLSTDPVSSLEAMISQADDLLYRAKQEGRNRLVHDLIPAHS